MKHGANIVTFQFPDPFKAKDFFKQVKLTAYLDSKNSQVNVYYVPCGANMPAPHVDQVDVADKLAEEMGGHAI